MHVHHQVLVHVAHAGHGTGGDHVQHHLLRGAGLHAGGAGDDLGAHVGHNRDIRGRFKRRAMVAGHRSGFGAAGTGIGYGGYHVGCAARSRKANYNIFAGGAAARDVALAQFFGIFVYFHGRGKRLRSAGHDVLHLARSGGVGGWTL